MGVRVVQRNKNQNSEKGGSEYIDSNRAQRETTVDGYTFHWGQNEKRNFLDDGVGTAHASFSDVKASGVEENLVPFNNPRF